MYGYPEQFIPAPELIGYSRLARRPRRVPAHRHGARHRRRRGDGMKKIEAFIRHEAFEPIRTELLQLGLPLDVDLRGQGLGTPEGHHRALPRRRADQLPAPEAQDRVRGCHRRRRARWSRCFLRHARTGAVGDGKVFVMAVEQAYRIRTGESGEDTLQAHPDAAAAAAS